LSASAPLITSLGLGENFLAHYRPPPQNEAAEHELQPIAHADTLKPVLATAKTAICWKKMSSAAAQDGISLYVISGFRSIEYQFDIIQRKLNAGQDMNQILRISALPGFSEHHTGRALDLGQTGTPPLTEEFEQTSAFNWLQSQAKEFSFSMSYPRGNQHGIAFEPWHWLCSL
jgi:D-alanyl-D-alanine carboxypeptidase